MTRGKLEIQVIAVLSVPVNLLIEVVESLVSFASRAAQQEREDREGSQQRLHVSTTYNTKTYSIQECYQSHKSFY